MQELIEVDLVIVIQIYFLEHGTELVLGRVLPQGAHDGLEFTTSDSPIAILVK